MRAAIPRRADPARIALYALLAASALSFVLPVVVVVLNSLKTMDEIRQGNLTRGEMALNVNMAATILTALPTLLVYLESGRYFVRGIAAGAVKG